MTLKEKFWNWYEETVMHDWSPRQTVRFVLGLLLVVFLLGLMLGGWVGAHFLT